MNWRPGPGVDQVSSWLGEIDSFDGMVLVVVPPHFVEFDQPLPSRIIGLQHFDPLYRIGAAERHQRITEPFAPVS